MMSLTLTLRDLQLTQARLARGRPRPLFGVSELLAMVITFRGRWRTLIVSIDGLSS